MDMTYEQIKAKQDADRLMHQWWTLIGEPERAIIVMGIRGCFEYGLAMTINQMPEVGQLAVREAYARHLIRVAELEGQHPAS